jgi:ribosome maturation factor RimP
MSRDAEKDGRIRAMAQAAAESRGVELLDSVLVRAGRRQIVRLIVDCAGGVTVDQCAEVSRRMSADLDMADILDGRYTLEVSSPGIDWPLKTAADFRRKIGREATVQYTGDDDSPQTVQGLIGNVNEETVKVGDCELPFDRIREGKLVV